MAEVQRASPNGPLPPHSEVVAWIKTFMDEHGYAPSHKEIGEAFRIKNRGSVHYLVLLLERDGWIKRDLSRKQRNITVTSYAPNRIMARLRAYVRALEWYVNELERGDNPEPARLEAVRVRSLMSPDDFG